MIFNIQDFHSFIKKINSGLGKFNEVIFPFHASPIINDNSSFRFARFEETKNPEHSYYQIFDPLKILLHLSREKVYPLKEHNAKRIIPGTLAGTNKSLKSILKNYIKRDSELITYG